ncbi:MAG: aldolase/citrate lyase family protein [Dehalococcoidia bacterium]|nr:aldolase/citrate lyase family protein [Dehalococcoidia bacterium]
MDGINLKQTLSSGGFVFGCMLSGMGTTRFRRTLEGSDLDYVVIDSEHGSRDRKEIQELCQMLRDINVAPIVRIPVPMAHWVAMALDAGAAGILVPYCETIEEVQECVATAKWHPLKGEYLRRAVEENILPSDDSKKYLEARHAETVIIIGIESEPAYQRLDTILEVKGIDGIFVGPNDMTTSLGIPDQVTNPKYLEVLSNIIKKSESHSIPVMIHQQTIETSIKAIELGARFILHSSDSRFMQSAMQEQMSHLRNRVSAISGKDFTGSVADTVETV